MARPRARIFAAAVAAALGALTLAYWCYRQTLGYCPPPAKRLTPAQAQAARAEVRQAVQQIQQATRAARAGQKPELNLEIREEAIDTLLKEEEIAARISRAGIHEPRVHVMPGAVVNVGAWVQRGGRRVWVSGSLQLAAEAGKLTARPMDMRLGNMPMPGFMEQRLMERLRAGLDRVNLPLAGRNVRIESSQGVLRISTAQ